MAMGAKPEERGCQWHENDQKEEKGEDHFRHQSGQHRVECGRMLAVPVGAKSAGQRESCLPLAMT